MLFISLYMYMVFHDAATPERYTYRPPCSLHYSPPICVPRARRLARHAARVLRSVEGTAGAGIDRAGRPMRRGEAGGDIGAGAEAGIDEAPRLQRAKSPVIGAEMMRLAGARDVPTDPAHSEVGARHTAKTPAESGVGAGRERPGGYRGPRHH